jgi:uncharacterized protein
MRRGEKQITDPAEVSAILAQARVLCVAFHDTPAPYALPFSFGWEEGTLYVHCAPVGRKLDLLAADPRVGFTAWTDDAVVPGRAACDWGVRAQSVAGTGTARVLTDPAERLRGLDAIMRHSGALPGAAGFSYGPETLARTAVIAVRIDTLTAKRVG